MLDMLSLIHIDLMQILLQYVSILKELKNFHQKTLPILYSDPEMKNISPEGVPSMLHTKDVKV